MKQLLHTFLLCGSLLALASCGTDSLLPTPDADGNTPGEPDARPLITITADMGAGASTRTGHDDITDEGVKVSWAEGDKFIIYSIDAAGKKIGEGSVFTLVAGEAGKASAAFEGTKPVAGTEYCICYPADVMFDEAGYGMEYAAYLSLRGQKQTGNNSTAHLSKLDPMQGHPVVAGDFSKISFTPDITNHPESGHCTTLMRFDLTNIPLDLGTPERIVLGAQDVGSYFGFAPSAEVGGELILGIYDPTFTLTLDNVTASGRAITAYMMLGSFTMIASSKLTITLEGSQKSYTFTSPAFDAEKKFERGVRYIASANKWDEAVIKFDGSAFAGTNYTGGKGTAASPYLISTAGDLQKLIEDVKGGTNYRGKYFKLTRNIHIAMASGTAWTPIGKSSTYSFNGHFDGGGHTISGEMTGSADPFGFFGTISGATITNLHVSATVTNTYTFGNTGVIAGNATSSTISYCTNAGAVSSKYGSGGIVSVIKECTLINCTNTGSVTAGTNAGGITGESTSSAIIGCANTGEITASSSSGRGGGGIVGYFKASTTTEGKIYGCFNTGLIKQGDYMGAIIGRIGDTGTFTVESCRYVLAGGQAAGLVACKDKTDDTFTDVVVCADVAALNADAAITALNAGITKWNSTAAADLPTCYPFRSGGSAVPAIALPASSGGIGNITDGGDALN